jgi:hypothetical protein
MLDLPSSNRTTTAIGKSTGAGVGVGVGTGVAVALGVGETQGVGTNVTDGGLTVGVGPPQAATTAISVDSVSARLTAVWEETDRNRGRRILSPCWTMTMLAPTDPTPHGVRARVRPDGYRDRPRIRAAMPCLPTSTGPNGGWGRYDLPGCLVPVAAAGSTACGSCVESVRFASL